METTKRAPTKINHAVLSDNGKKKLNWQAEAELDACHDNLKQNNPACYVFLLQGKLLVYFYPIDCGAKKRFKKELVCIIN